MKKSNGFTLVELLAVIVILGVIALIATPIVLNVVEDARFQSQKRSIDMYARAIKLAVSQHKLTSGKSISGSFSTENKNSIKNLASDEIITVDYDGNVACENILIDSNGDVLLSSCSLSEKNVDYAYAEGISNMLYQHEYDPNSNIDENEFLNTNLKSSMIKSLQLHTTGTSIQNKENYASKDCSFLQDKSVMCYWKEDSIDPGYYEFHIAANGEIYAPYISKGLLARVGYHKMTNLDLTGLNTKYAVDMYAILARVGYEEMTELNLGSNFDTSKVVNMLDMFYEAGYKKLIKLDLGDKFDTSNVTNMYAMFFYTGHENMEELNLGNKFDTSNVTNMYAMFDNAGYKLNSLDLGDKFDTSNVTKMDYMFSKTGLEEMTSLRLGSKFVIPNTASIDGIFRVCGKQDNSIRVYVSNQAVKDKIKSFSDYSVPSLWKTNDSIIVIQ